MIDGCSSMLQPLNAVLYLAHIPHSLVFVCAINDINGQHCRQGEEMYCFILFAHVGGSNQVNKANLHASVSTPSGPPGTCLPDALVFSNPIPSTALHDLPGPSACSGGILRCVSSLSASMSSSTTSRLRPHRGPPSGRHDLSRRSIPGPSGSRSAGRASQTSGGSGVCTQHHHHHHAQTSTQQQQQQPQHQQQQGSGINYRILQLKMAFGDVASQLILLQEINQVRTCYFTFFVRFFHLTFNLFQLTSLQKCISRPIYKCD